jgi:tRNA (cmo5U34)-methyltransferase
MHNHFIQPPGHSYLEGPPRQVPGYHSLHRMVTILLAEHLTAEASVLVLGAGGGLEIKALAEAQSGWSFDGVDPSAGMLELAADTVANYQDRVRLHQGYIEDAPQGPFDGAICLLTFHFIPREMRLETLQQIQRRLKPKAPLIIAHHSFPQTEPERTLWISRHLAFGNSQSADPEVAKEAMKTKLSILAPDEEEALLKQAGFSGISLFYAGFSFKGWVAYAG